MMNSKTPENDADDPMLDGMAMSFVSDVETNQRGRSANVVDGLFAIARGLESVAYQIKYLGNGDAATTMGAIESLSVQIKEGLDSVASATNDGLTEVSRSIDLFGSSE